MSTSTRIAGINRLQPIALLLIAAAFALVLMFDIRYATQAWFHQDDFNLMEQYRDSVHWAELLNLNDFGRFVTRNVYWSVGLFVFGNNATAFYLANLVTIAATSAVIYAIFRPRLGSRHSLVAALLYFCLPAVVIAYIWIANSQHLIGHFFALLFVWLYMKDDAPRMSAAKLVGLIAIFIVGLLSNVFVGFVISLPIWFMLFEKAKRRDKGHWILAGVGCALFLYLIHSLHRFQTGPYSVEVSAETFMVNLDAYFHHVWIFAVWLVICIGGGLHTLARGRRFESWLFVASLLFFSPFAFLKFQHYLQYVAMQQLFFLLGFWSLLCMLLLARHQVALIRIGAALVVIIFLTGISQMRGFMRNPRGSGAKLIVAELAAFDGAHPEIQHYCFSAPGGHISKTGIKVWNIPDLWWHVAFGTAFKQFVSPNKSYQLVQDTGPCDVTFDLEEDHIILDTTSPDGH